MVLNEGKKKKLVELFAKRRAVAAGVGISTSTTLPSSTTFASNSSEPTPVDKQKGVVVETGSEDEDIGSGLVFKRQRWMTSWRLRTLHLEAMPHPLGTTLQAPPVDDLPAILQQALKCFKNREMVDSLREDLL